MAGFPIGQIQGAMPPPQQGAPPAMPPRPAPKPQGPMSGMFLLLSFLAGAGLDKATNSVSKLLKLGQPGTADPNRAHRGGVRLDAARNPGMTIAPQMASMLAAKSAQQPSGSDDLVALLAKALQMQVGPGGGGPIGTIG